MTAKPSKVANALLRRPVAAALVFALMAPAAGKALEPGATDSTEQPQAATNPANELEKKRDETRKELEELSRTMALSQEKRQSLQDEIAQLEKSSTAIRTALIESAARRKKLEASIRSGEKRMADLKVRKDRIHASLNERRGVLAEVLAALQRMGRNPPPALLVTPDDALASVRSAILLGAVVPGIRNETEKLVADLTELSTLETALAKEKADMTATMTASLEEDKRMDLLLSENARISRENTEQLASEKQKASELAGRATSLEGLIASLESEIGSVRKAAEAARLEQERRLNAPPETKPSTGESMPDKNRIAPAYAFSELKAKLDYPVEGEVLRKFGDPDGTGHSSRGLVLATGPDGLVTAPADGTVVFAGTFRSYGEMIILNLGDGYHMVLSGMDQVKVSAGKFVFSGEPIAAMGAKRVASATALALETDRPTLYIELRKDGEPVDSRPWWIATDAGKARNDS